MKNLTTLLLLIIAAGVGYMAYSEYQKRQIAYAVVEKYTNPHGIADLPAAQKMIGDFFLLAGRAKRGVDDYYVLNGEFPSTLFEAGVTIAADSLPKHIDDVYLAEDGEIVGVFNPREVGLPKRVNRAVLRITPSIWEDGGLLWECTADYPLNDYSELVPELCLH